MLGSLPTIMTSLAARYRLLAATTIVCAVGGAWWFWQGPSNPPSKHGTIRIVGHDVPTNRALSEQSVRAYMASNITLRLGNRTLVRTREALGATFDGERLDWMLRHADEGESFDYLLPVRLNTQKAISALVAVKDDLDDAPEDAKIDLQNRKTVNGAKGVRVDVYATLDALEDAIMHGKPEVAVSFEALSPRVATEKLANVSMNDSIGHFDTRYATDSGHIDRTFNLRLAASKVNGKVIFPGETFDFNAVVGPRDVAHGYRVAKVIADGELIDGIGGGTCQIAGTLHGAALFAGLEIVARTPHTRPSFYIKMGLDAAVAYPSVNLKIRNPYPYPVVLNETVSGGMVRADVLGRKRTHTITFVRRIEEIIPFSEREVTDDALKKGTRLITQRGIPGFKVLRLRIVRQGPFAVRERTMDSYPPTTQIVHVGTGTENTSPLLDDEHPEYIADEFLMITQGPGIGRTGTEEMRVAGRTGSHGWTRHFLSTRSRRDDDDTN